MGGYPYLCNSRISVLRGGKFVEIRIEQWHLGRVAPVGAPGRFERHYAQNSLALDLVSTYHQS